MLVSGGSCRFFWILFFFVFLFSIFGIFCDKVLGISAPNLRIWRRIFPPKNNSHMGTKTARPEFDANVLLIWQYLLRGRCPEVAGRPLQT